MTLQHRDLVLRLTVPPVGGPPLAPDEFLRAVGATDGRELGARLLTEALHDRDREAVHLALVVCAVFGVDERVADQLMATADADWHTSHEDAVSLLARLHEPRAVPVLLRAARTVPGYLARDEHRALAVKAVHALGALPGGPAERALELLADDPSDVVRAAARAQLARRAGDPDDEPAAPPPDAGRFPVLAHLMEVYLPPEWQEDFDSPDAAVAEFLDRDAAAAGLADEVRGLLDADPSEAELTALLLDRLGGGYVPDPADGTVRAWLAGLARRAEAR